MLTLGCAGAAGGCLERDVPPRRFPGPALPLIKSTIAIKVFYVPFCTAVSDLHVLYGQDCFNQPLRAAGGCLEREVPSRRLPGPALGWCYQ